MACRFPTCVRCSTARIALLLVWFIPGSFCWAQIQRSIPSRSYTLAKGLLYQGEYLNAEKVFLQELRSAIKTPQSRWIDSICYHAMLGETYYLQGRNAEALEQFNRACGLALDFPNWMLQIQYPAIRPVTNSVRAVAPWGRTTRPNVVYGAFPDSMSIQIGKLITESDIQQGGVLTPAQGWVINVHEIIRCTAHAIRRRNILLGPIAPHDNLSGLLAAQPSGGGGVPANHWSVAWIDVKHGIAQAGVDQLEQARQLLNRSVLVGGQFDHPLTCVALLEQGRLVMQAGDLASAGRLFEEASYAAYFYEDLGVIEEALALGAQVHFASGGKGIYPPLDAAIVWANRDRLRHIQASMLLLKAENLILLGQPAVADALLKGDLQKILGRKELRGSSLAGQHQYLSAWVAYQLNRPKPGENALKNALLFGARSGLWNFQISLLNGMFDNSTIRPRTAAELYENLLRDPLPADWTLQPFESLSQITTPHHDAYDRWFAATLALQKVEAALEIADRDKRHRFLSKLPLGGRLLALRTILQAQPQQFVGNPVLQRQDLLTRYPQYDKVILESRGVERELRKLSLAPANTNAERELQVQMSRWDRLTKECEVLLRHMALGHHASDLVFPPMLSTADLQNAMEPGQVLIVFHECNNRLYGFALTSDDYSVWEVGAIEQLGKDIAGLLKAYGNHDANRAVPHDVIAADTWRKTASVVYQRLFKEARLNLDQANELILVPDHVLWYVPVEALVVNDAATSQPLLQQMKIRYAPTAGISLGLTRPPRKILRTGIVSGRLFPRDSSEVGETSAAELAEAITGSVVLPSPPIGAPRLNAALFDQLVVLADCENDPARPIDWAPIPTPGNQGESLFNWLILPNGEPEFVILPGFHTLAESGMRSRGANIIPGNEVFTTLCSFFARGSRSVLLSRWRAGGQTSIDLIREFVQESPHTSGAEAWQRSVLLAMDSPIDPTREPRIEYPSGAGELKARHPFFWAGYLLADTGETSHQENQENQENKEDKEKDQENVDGKEDLDGKEKMDGKENPDDKENVDKKAEK